MMINLLYTLELERKAVLARGEEFNYIKDYPQDLYILYNDTGKPVH